MDKKNDIFSEIIKNKLENYTLPVDEDSWDKIAERLKTVPKKKTQRQWIAAIAVAASIALLFLIFSINKKTYHHETADPLSDHEKTIVQDVPEKEIVQPVIPQDVESSTVIRKFQPGERLAENKRSTEVISTEEFPEENPVIFQKEEPSTPENPPVFTDSYNDFEKEMQTPVIKSKKRQSIRFSLGSGSNLLAENSTNSNPIQKTSIFESPFFRAATQAVTDSRTEDILKNEDYPNVVHHLPLSFGVTVKKELSRTFAIESGIVYSYMTTSFSRQSYPKSNANLQLHYIGIPLNVHTRIFGNRFSQWEIYLSTGGMIEKGVLSHFKQKTYFDTIDNQVTTVVSDEKIKGLQWSIGISPGVDYQIYKNYSIYFEPKLSYYFDNNQPVSARTKHPVIVGLNAGVRYVW